ncbi:hypothetical protein T265_01918 [Opisthorchis viverrini]|uniref:Endonuclease/exonuclease/phosphatase domain-containing protein n=1 Tax=Opisthorchis viverrini TaxID=6198 RepID=A0A075A8E0_OPIVI|nr:hypothetical protein T265_01918 [Opisthorchis viverrini]KER31990.1 hypothetical protein T265_01918 [Opisthorchis viverrini]
MNATGGTRRDVHAGSWYSRDRPRKMPTRQLTTENLVDPEAKRAYQNPNPGTPAEHFNDRGFAGGPTTDSSCPQSVVFVIPGAVRTAYLLYLGCSCHSSVLWRFGEMSSGDPEAAAVGCAGVGIVLSHRAEVSLLDWIPVDSCLCAVRLATSVKESHKRQVDRRLFMVSAYAPTDCGSDAVKDRFHDALNALLWRAKSSGIVVVAGDMNAQGMHAIERLSPAEFTAYLDQYGNTICGRHPIGILLQMVESLRKGGGPSTQFNFKFIKYTQSEHCQSMNDSSVSYAAGSLLMR